MVPQHALGRLADASTWVRSNALRRWPFWIGVFAVAALAATLLNAQGAYVFDNRFEQYWNPGQRVAKNLTAWDATRGLGRTREEFWPLATVPLWLLDLLGASPATIERLWHAGLLWSAAIGTMVVVRRFVPGSMPVAALAGAVYAFGPFSAVFLTPSVLFMYFAVTPWFIHAIVRGVESPTPWRPAAGLALLVFAVGNADPPALAYVLVPMAVVVAYLVFGERSATTGDVFRALVRGGVLVAMTSAAMVVKTYIAAGAFAQRLYSTESPEVAGSASSWGESFRGLGFWVPYLRVQGDLVRPQSAPLFSNALLILATFAVPVVALAGLWVLRSRLRLLFGTLLALGTAVMVGPFPLEDSSPWGRGWLWAAAEVPGFAALRSTYKVGATYSLGVGTLFALSIALLSGTVSESGLVSTGRRRRDPDASRSGDATRARAVWAAGVFAVAVSAFPFWSGNLYDAELRVEDGVPDYWLDAMDWLDAQPGETRVLTVPGLTRARYRWGSPGDDIIDAYLERPHAENIAIPLTTPEPADLLEAVDAGIVDGTYVPGSIAPILRRIGVEYVLVRNDLLWEEVGVARPALLQDLRDDPDLVLAATFGADGENTVGPVYGPVAIERRLPPVEIYRLVDPPAALARVTGDPWRLLDGGGDGWWRLSETGALDAGEPVVYATSIDDALLTDRLRAGDRLYVTDTNRRTSQSVFVYNAARSWTLGPGEEFGRGVPELFPEDGTQSVAVHGGDATIRDLDAERALIAGFRPQHRAAQAFDGDPTTGWVASALLDPRGRTLRVDLPGGQTMSGVTVEAFDPRRPDREAGADSFSGVPRIGRLTLRLSSGAEYPVNAITGTGSVSFPATDVAWFEIEIEDVTRTRQDVGIAEIEVHGLGLDLRERIRVPERTFRRAEADAALGKALSEAAISYLFERQIGSASTPVESQLRREFDTVGTRSFVLTGRAAWPDDARRSCGHHGLSLDGRSIAIRAVGADGFAACRPVELAAGRHRIEGIGAFVVDAVALEASAPGVGSDRSEGAGGEARLVGSGDGSRRFEIEASRGAVLLSGDAHDPRWQARAETGALGAPVMMDVQNAWVLPADTGAGVDDAVVELWFPPATWFRWSLVVTAIGVVLCAGLVVRPPRRNEDRR